jgi:hypothetical protein
MHILIEVEIEIVQEYRVNGLQDYLEGCLVVVVRRSLGTGL